MKKISVIIIISALVIMTSCGSVRQSYADSLSVMRNVWDGYSAQERFSAVGGDSGTATRDMPARYNVTDDAAREKDLMLPSGFAFAVSDVSCIRRDDGRGELTAAAYLISDSENIGATAAAIRSRLMQTAVYELPEKYVAVSVGDKYLLTAYGNESDINTFLTKSLSQLDGAVILYDEPVTPISVGA